MLSIYFLRILLHGVAVALNCRRVLCRRCALPLSSVVVIWNEGSINEYHGNEYLPFLIHLHLDTRIIANAIYMMPISTVEMDNAFPSPSFAVGREGTNYEASRHTRDRSYSDGHYLFENKTNEATIETIPVTAQDQDTSTKEGIVRTKVHHRAPNRPRSKSESEYRPSYYKKNNSHGKQLSGTHSPHHGPRPCSPKNLLQPMSFGKMWIRPMPSKQTGRSSPPYVRYAENHAKGACTASGQLQPHVRQVSSSPPAEAEIDITLPMLHSTPCSSFENYHKEKPVMAFGESGKPIKPIAMFRHDSPIGTASGSRTYPWRC